MQQSATIDVERSDGETGIVDSSSATNVPKMLIVDDDPLVLRLLVEHCTRIGFDVETASNGMQALFKASRIRPAILVIDVNMPEMDGLSTCAHLLEPDRSPVEVIVMTGGKNPDTAERCEGFGAYFARKGPNFWTDLEAALTEIDPRLTETFRHLAAGATEQEVRRRPRVLLVDDDNDVNRMLASRLAKCGIDVTYAQDASQGYRLACRDEPAVIVTDYFMPNGDAHYFLSKLRTDKATSGIPVIVLSGRRLSDQIDLRLRREIAGRPGAAHILSKSEDTSALFDILQKFCGFEPTSISSAVRGNGQPTRQMPRILNPCSELAAAAYGRFDASRGKTN
jgi:CheY-like chemotaxis protein